MHADAPRTHRSPRLLWLLRLGVLLLVVGYLLSPGLQLWLPPWLPFLAALAVEAHFFLAGARARGRARAGRDTGPQERDLADLGWADRTVEFAFGDTTLVLHAGDLDAAELAAWIQDNAAELVALGPGTHELGPVDPDGGVRLWEPPPAAPRRGLAGARLVPSVLVLLLVAGALLAATRRTGWESLGAADQRDAAALVSAQAAIIAGRPATVVCDEQGARVGYVHDADGLAEVGGRRAWVTPSICLTLYRLSEGNSVPDSTAGRAIAVLAHEAWHLRGIANEGVANCYAFQSGVGLGRRLGLSDGRAAALMRSQLADNAAVATPAYQVPSGCANGGRYDLSPASPRFP